MKQKFLSDSKNGSKKKTEIDDIRMLAQQNNELIRQISDRLNNRNQVINLEQQLKAEKKHLTNTSKKVELLTFQLEKIQQIVQKQKLQQQQQLFFENKPQVQRSFQKIQQSPETKRRSKSSNLRNVDVSFIKSKIRQALQEVFYEYLE